LAQEFAVSADRLDVVHESIPAQADAGGEDLRAELGLAADTFVVGAAGKLGWRKGSDLFVQIASLVQNESRGREIRFLWLGGGAPGAEAYEELLHDVRLLGLEQTVTHLPGRADPAPFFRTLDVFLLPSREDPYPLVGLEAAAAGVPMICFAHAGGMPEFVEHDAGFVVPYLDLPAAAEAILGLHAEPGLRRKMCACAREKVRARHDISVAGPQLLAAIMRAWEEKR
jgi:glycosyltransferase involved in cell wall biosynthesis